MPKFISISLAQKSRSGNGASGIARGPNVITSNNLVIMKRSRDSQIQNFPEGRTLKSPKRVIVKATYGNKELTDNDGSCFSLRGLFALPFDGGSLNYLHFVERKF